MKLSNKVLLGFFGFIFLYLTAAFAELRLTGTTNRLDNKNSIAETVDISGVTYLKLDHLGKHAEVTTSDRPRLEVRSLTGALLKELEYTVSGDTLTLSGFHSVTNKAVRLSVFVSTTSLKGITLKSASATIEGLQQDSLHLSQNAGRIWMSKSKISNIQTDLSNNSSLDISTTTLGTVSATIAGSQLHIRSHVGLVQGEIKEKSLLQLTELGEIQIKKDESSRLQLY